MARKADAGKARMELVSWDAVTELAQVMTFGAEKYDDRNYLGLAQSRIFASGVRHMVAWFLGEDMDPESGLHHLAHAMANCMMLRDIQLRGSGEDDRPWKKEEQQASSITVTMEDFEEQLRYRVARANLGTAAEREGDRETVETFEGKS